MQVIGNTNLIDLQILSEPTSPSNNSNQIVNLSIPVFYHLLLLPISSHVTIGLAKIFDFEVLNHGTSFSNCYGIWKFGADPSKNNTDIGSTFYYEEGDLKAPALQVTEPFFYVFKDTKAQKSLKLNFEDLENHLELPLTRDLYFRDKVEIYFAPRVHAAFSALSHTIYIKNNIKKFVHTLVFGLPNFLFSPITRFIYDLDEIKDIFENDPNYDGLAYRTSLKLPNNRIGLIGVCLHANKERLTNGIKKRPLRFLTGVIHLVAGTILTCMGLGLFS